MNIIETKISLIVQMANSWKDYPLMNLTSWRMKRMRKWSSNIARNASPRWKLKQQRLALVRWGRSVQKIMWNMWTMQAKVSGLCCISSSKGETAWFILLVVPFVCQILPCAIEEMCILMSFVNFGTVARCFMLTRMSFCFFYLPQVLYPACHCYEKQWGLLSAGM